MLDDEEGMQVLQCVTSPMDLLTMLYKVSDSIFAAVSLWFFVCQTHDTLKCELCALRSAQAVMIMSGRPERSASGCVL
jgi:hypothetical protein